MVLNIISKKWHIPDWKPPAKIKDMEFFVQRLFAK
jgi:hypothetical protein